MHPTRQALIRVAMRLFAEKGYTSTSVADILSEAKVNSGSLYHHFETKQSLLLGVLESYRDGIETMLIQPACAGVGDPVERVFALLARYRDLLVASDCCYGCPIGSLALELHEPDPPVRVLLAANFDRWTAFVEECFNTARDRLPPDLDRHALAQFVLTTMEGGVMLSRTHRSIEAFDAAVAMLKDYLSRLLFPANSSNL
jgi:TetR/AcrR family transcriptional regulator, transcriptional repressor for nem operon